MREKNILIEIIIYLLIFVFLIIPPFFTPRITDTTYIFSWNLPSKQLILCLFALVLYFALNNSIAGRDFSIFVPTLRSIGGLCILLLISRFILTRCDYPIYTQPKPIDTKQWIFCFLTFLLSSIYEEIIYRFYIPEETSRLFYLKFDSIFFDFLSGFIAALVFAFAHFYMGWFSVLNAFLAHLILRILYKDTGCIWNCVLAHFLYNIIALILL